MYFNFIIVGQGLAGTTLALHLLKEKKSILIIDEYRKITSSKVAAGIFNPITGMRFTKSWMAEEFFNYAEIFYPEIEKMLHCKFFHQRSIQRFFGNIKEQNTWMSKSNSTEIKNFVGKDFIKNPPYITGDFGGFEITKGGYLDTEIYLEKSREHFENLNIIKDEIFEYDQLKNNEKRIEYKNFTTDKIIFCEGFRAVHNPFFKSLPFTFSKGELIDIKIDINSENIYNKNGFILPLGNGICRMGSTYIWNDLTETVTEGGLSELTEKLEKITNLPYEIINKKSSIRPTTKDRRPFLGHHKSFENIYIFNGLGSKGVSLAPYFAMHLTSHFLEKKSLLKECDIARFN